MITHRRHLSLVAATHRTQHAALDRFDHVARPVVSALLDLPPDHAVTRDSTGAVTAPLLLAQLLDGSLSVAEVTRLLIAASVIRPGIDTP